MGGFAPSDGGRGPARRFRLVDLAGGPAPVAEGDERGEVASLISPRLLVSLDAWRVGLGLDPNAEERRVVRVQAPLVASLARVRSAADAALALTGVLEYASRHLRVALPCGSIREDTVCFEAPADVPLDAIREAFDEHLLAVVRGDDLEGGLRDRMTARVEATDPSELE